MGLDCASENGHCIERTPCSHQCTVEWTKYINERYPKPRQSRPGLYRHFDADGSLLYVGMSLDVMNRTRSHALSAWWNDVATITIERFETKEQAAAAELHAIRTERPLHNRAGAPK